MKINTDNLLIIAVPILLAAYMVLELRLHQTYRDYRTHSQLECFNCCAIASEVSDEYEMPAPWYSFNYDQAQAVPRWLRKSDFWLKPVDIVVDASRACRHIFMEARARDRYGREFCVFDNTRYLLPCRFHQVRRIAASVLGLFAATLLLWFGFRLARVRTQHWIARTLAWGWLFVSSSLLLACALYPIGIPATDLLDECRATTIRLTRSGKAAVDWGRVAYLLSGDAIQDCERHHIDVQVPNYVTSLDSNELTYYVFPRTYIRQAQVRLAIAAAPYNEGLVKRFFYGDGYETLVSHDWKSLTENLDSHLVNRNPAFEKGQLRVNDIGTNQCGTVNVTWYGTESDNCYKTIYRRFGSESGFYWAPVRTVCTGVFFAGYLPDNRILMW